MKLDSLITKIRLIMVKHDRRLPPPCAKRDLAAFAKRFETRFRQPPPKAYLHLLSLCDGMNFNGAEIFGTRKRGHVSGLLHANSMLNIDRPEDMEDLVCFGRTEMDLYVYDTSLRIFKQHSHSGDDLATFKTFERMLTRMFRGRINLR